MSDFRKKMEKLFEDEDENNIFGYVKELIGEEISEIKNLIKVLEEMT